MSAMFGRKTAKKPASTCLLLSKDSALLGRGELKSAPGDQSIQIKIISGEIKDITAAGVVQIIPTNQSVPPQMGQVLLDHGDLVVFRPMRQLGESMRQNFRMPVDFESFVYPASGGRAFVRALDLSCGGIAMYSAQPLKEGERCEIVIPIIQEGPMIVDCEILRALPFNGPIQRYAAKFVDLIDDQESALREAVFQAQARSVQQRRKNG